MPDLESSVADLFAPAFAAVAGGPVDPVVRRSQHADFQVDGALPLARTLSRPPRDIARDVIARLGPSELIASATVSGPGFINVTIADAALGRLLAAARSDERLGVAPAGNPETVIVDYSGPNVAKELHVGHLRSTVIGDACARLLSWLGHDVIRANHIGDWGTPFGMLIEHLLDLGEDAAAHELSVGDLDSFYQGARAKFDADPAFAERARQRVVALQSGDATTLRLWRLLVAESEAHFRAVYDTLGTQLADADFVGESFYDPLLGPLVSELDEAGLLRDSDGAKVVFPAGILGRDGEPLPIIIRKRDGGFGYGATDLAAIRHRTQELKATRLLYVVGSPQQRHFELVFQAAREAGWLTAPARAQHIGFGQVLGADGRKLASRAGGAVKLAELLSEAVDRAATIVAEKNPSLGTAQRAAIAHAVGIGAIKYADLSSDRGRDYLFAWDRMLATTGDTAAYLQYTYARIRSIFRRGGAAPSADAAITVVDPAEHALALELLAFPAVIDEVAETLRFHTLTGYLQGLAGAFTAFYDRCPVLRADGGTRASRLALCDLTARVLAQGLDLLGISTPERM
ncbi:arginine--tRNA ligase [Luedemannella helvata]|uniref:Arginine--tRNA ligase n=1 Tax=Luedemannella helvata TaxID=349315 RepID=A0ABN2JSS6_9ACTN